MPSRFTKRIEALEVRATSDVSEFDHVLLYGGDRTREQALAEKGLTTDERVLWVHLVGVEPGPDHPANQGKAV